MMNKPLPKCPVEVALRLLNNRWKMLIVRDLATGEKRFGELKKSLGSISASALTMNLRSMEEDGLVDRCIYQEIPLHTDYRLTETGLTLIPIIEALKQWGETYMKDVNSEDE